MEKIVRIEYNFKCFLIDLLPFPVGLSLIDWVSKLFLFFFYIQDSSPYYIPYINPKLRFFGSGRLGSNHLSADLETDLSLPFWIFLCFLLFITILISPLIHIMERMNSGSQRCMSRMIIAAIKLLAAPIGIWIIFQSAPCRYNVICNSILNIFTIWNKNAAVTKEIIFLLQMCLLTAGSFECGVRKIIAAKITVTWSPVQNVSNLRGPWPGTSNL